MKKVGDHVNRTTLETGNLLIKEHPHTFAHDAHQYMIWHQDTGEIIWVGRLGLGADAYHVAFDMCCAMNNHNPYVPNIKRRA